MPRKKKTEENSTIQPTQIASSIETVEIPEFMIDSYHKYLSYIICGRVTCNLYDGFKNIYRRILIAANDICKDKFIKSARLTGNVYNYSPHGDSYSSIVKAVNNGYLEGHGNFGNLFAIEPDGAAAQRYTEVKLHPVSEILYLNKDLLPYVPYKETESSKKNDIIMEPLFLPALLPGIFVGLPNTTEFDSNMALKLSVTMPRYAVLSLLNYVIKYLTEKIWDPTILYYQHHNIVKQVDTDTKSSYEVEFGIPTIEDKDGNIHLLSTLPTIQMISKFKSIPVIDKTTSSTDIVFNKKYYTNQFRKKVKFNMKAYKMIDNDCENVQVYDYPIRYAIQIILNTLKTFLFPRYFSDQEQKALNKIKELEILKSARDKYVDKHTPFDQLTKEEQLVSSKHSSASFMTIEKRINDLNSVILTLKTRSQNIDKEILKLYQDAFDKISKYMAKYIKDKKIKIYDVSKI